MRLATRLLCHSVLFAGLPGGMATMHVCAQAVPSTRAAAAESSPSPEATNNNDGPSGIVPRQPGLNASLTTSTQHDSVTGWSNLVTPNVAYRFNRYLSADASASVFTTINVNAKSTGKAAAATTQLKTVHGAATDTAVAGHLDLPVTSTIAYTFTSTLGLPTGNKAYGLGAGQVSYDLNNHFERDMLLAPFIEFGFGDTSQLLNRRVRRNQTSVGNLAHFEVGGSADLPLHASFNASAFESLPIGNQNITATKTVRKKTVTVIKGTTGLAEDNGFNSSLDIPVQKHLVLSGLYTRSLRQHSDTAGFSLTYFARAKQAEDDDQ